MHMHNMVKIDIIVSKIVGGGRLMSLPPPLPPGLLVVLNTPDRIGLNQLMFNNITYSQEVLFLSVMFASCIDLVFLHIVIYQCIIVPYILLLALYVFTAECSFRCLHGGRCVPGVGRSSYCSCQGGWFGHYCEMCCYYPDYMHLRNLDIQG